jgi:hypothetical protein
MMVLTGGVDLMNVTEAAVVGTKLAANGRQVRVELSA